MTYQASPEAERVLALFEARAEVTFAELLDIARLAVGVKVRPFAEGGAALIQAKGLRACEVWDNGGEVGVALLDGDNLPEMVPLRVANSVLDPWMVWLAVLDSIIRLSRGLNGRGGDAPFPRMPFGGEQGKDKPPPPRAREDIRRREVQP